MFRYHLLGLLRDGHHRHGYALMKEYRQRAGLHTGTGSFYRELQKLVSEGMVQPVPNPREADPRRAPYKITKLGLAAFDNWFANVPPFNGATDNEMSARAIFLSEVDKPAAQDLLTRWQLDALDLCKRLERELREAFTTRRQESDALPLLVRRRLRYAAADLQFLEEMREALGLPEVPQKVEEPPSAKMFEERLAKSRSRV